MTGPCRPANRPVPPIGVRAANSFPLLEIGDGDPPKCCNGVRTSAKVCGSTPSSNVAHVLFSQPHPACGGRVAGAPAARESIAHHRSGSTASKDDFLRNTSRWAAVVCGTILAVVPGCGSAATDRPGNETTSAVVAGSRGAATTAARPKIVGNRQVDDGQEAVVLSEQREPSPFRFAEIAREAGIDFVHFSGMTEEKYFPTANGSGVAMFDYDNDGKLDLYFATATLLPLGTARKGPNRLFKNLGGGKFRDVTEAAGIGFAGFCHGIVVGDIDNDGDADVFLCNYGANVLYLNNGDGTFRDISQSARIDRPNWSSGGAFLDYDNDGDLDLYVANYGIWKLPEDDQFCGQTEPKRVRLYCSPNYIRPAKHQLYRNNGDLTFTDVYDQAILTIDPETKKPKPRSDGRGFAAVTADLNGDGLIDIYVTNDMNPNFLFLNRGDGTFEDATESSGAAYDEKGQAQSGMGVDAEDVNGDGLPDLLATNFANEYNTLHLNLVTGLFMDATAFFGLAADTVPFVGWGTALADFDNDGWPDNFVTNGHVDDNRQELGQVYAYAEPPLLFLNRDGKRFSLATRDAGPYFETNHVGRGAAFGDIDDDGDIDIVVNHKDNTPALLRNDTKSGNHWIRLELQGTRSNRDAVGTRVEVRVGGRTIVRQRKGGYSLESSNDPRLLIGVGPAGAVDRVTLRWPSGAVSTLEHLETDRSYKVVEPR
jgi:enediyne biosynthesis protein E4